MNYDLACWLQEAGRRDLGERRRPAPATIDSNPLRREDTDRPGTMEAARRPLLLAMLGLACMQYLFADVGLKIFSLHSLVFFVFQ